MELIGKLLAAYKNADGRTVLLTEADEVGTPEALDKLLHEERLRIRIERYQEKRSLNANAYFWKITSEIAKRLTVDKESQYLVQLYKYGSFFDVSVIDRALPMLRQTYRYTEVMDTGEMNGEPASVVRCYRGSSTYTREEMRYLIDGTVEDAKELGIDVLPPAEIEHLIAVWKGAFNEL